MLAARYWRQTVRIRPHLPPVKVMPLTPRKFLGIACSTPALMYHPGPRGTATRVPGVGQTSLALVQASKATHPEEYLVLFSPMRSPAAGFLPPPSRPSAAIRQRTVLLFLQFIRISATHPKTERERPSLSLSQIALFWCDS